MSYNQYNNTNHFYPRSPCGERRDVIAVMTEAQSISIHALLAESDLWVLRKVPLLGIFLSTLSLRRATANGGVRLSCFGNFYPRSPCGERLLRKTNTPSKNHYFYPRSPCGERLMKYSGLNFARNFYPRSPCGERRLELFLYYQDNRFLSTLSLRRATLNINRPTITIMDISIHALLAESDPSIVTRYQL